MQMLTLNASHTNCNAKERNEQACEWLAELCNLINPHPTFKVSCTFKALKQVLVTPGPPFVYIQHPVY